MPPQTDPRPFETPAFGRSQRPQLRVRVAGQEGAEALLELIEQAARGRPEVGEPVAPQRGDHFGREIAAGGDEAPFQTAAEARRRACGPGRRRVRAEEVDALHQAADEPLGEADAPRRVDLDALGGRVDDLLEPVRAGRCRRGRGRRQRGEHGERPGVAPSRAVVAGADGPGRAAPGIDEPVDQPVVQRVAQPVFDAPRALLPVAGVGDPRGPVGDVRPSADEREPHQQVVDVSFDPVETTDALGHPVGREPARRPRQRAEDVAEQRRVVFQHQLPVVGDLADVPQQPDAGLVLRAVAHRRVEGQRAQRVEVGAPPGKPQPGPGRPPVQRGGEGVEAGEVELAVAPHDVAGGGKAVVLDGPRRPRGEVVDRVQDAERPVVQVAAGAAGDLAQLDEVEVPAGAPVELGELGERHVVDVEVQPHADGVGGRQIVDFAALVQGDLGVARTRRQGPEHDGGAPAARPHPFREVVDARRRESHDRRARRQRPDLQAAPVAQGRQPRMAADGQVRDERGQQGADGARPQEPRLAPAAGVQQAVGEDVAPLGVGGELNLVDGQEVDLPVEGHRLHRAHPVARRGRHPLLFAGHQGHGLLAGPHGQGVVDLAGEQPQGQPDHAAAVFEQPLDGAVGLAGVGRAEQGGRRRTGRRRMHRHGDAVGVGSVARRLRSALDRTVVGRG